MLLKFVASRSFICLPSTHNNKQIQTSMKLTLYLLTFLLSLNIFATDKPNFLFILVDDLGRQDLNCYGSTSHETPHIGQLAKASVKFNGCLRCQSRLLSNWTTILKNLFLCSNFIIILLKYSKQCKGIHETIFFSTDCI